MEMQGRLSAARDYALYYGSGGDELLCRFDLAIVEPGGQSGASLKKMQESGTLVLGYLSVVEVPPWAEEFSFLKPQDFLGTKGEPYKNSQYGNYLADPRSTRWTRLLLHKAGLLLIRLGYDGLFLDTIGDVESEVCAAACGDSLLLSAAGIVRQLRELYPGKILVQNCGLERLCLFTARYLDGICWENPPLFSGPDRQWAEEAAVRLNTLKKKYGIRVLLLLEEGGPFLDPSKNISEKEIYMAAREILKNDNFLLYKAPSGYTAGINLPTGVGFLKNES